MPPEDTPRGEWCQDVKVKTAITTKGAACRYIIAAPTHSRPRAFELISSCGAYSVHLFFILNLQ